MAVDNVYLKSPRENYNCTLVAARSLARYLGKFFFDMQNMGAVSTAGNFFEEKWIVDNQYSPDEPLNLQFELEFEGQTKTHQVSAILNKFNKNRRKCVESLLAEYGVDTTDKLGAFYWNYDEVQDAINGLF
jgi:uncharacterized protein (DUF2164 family)